MTIVWNSVRASWFYNSILLFRQPTISDLGIHSGARVKEKGGGDVISDRLVSLLLLRHRINDWVINDWIFGVRVVQYRVLVLAVVLTQSTPVKGVFSFLISQSLTKSTVLLSTSTSSNPVLGIQSLIARASTCSSIIMTLPPITNSCATENAAFTNQRSGNSVFIYSVSFRFHNNRGRWLGGGFWNREREYNLPAPELLR